MVCGISILYKHTVIIYVDLYTKLDQRRNILSQFVGCNFAYYRVYCLVFNLLSGTILDQVKTLKPVFKNDIEIYFKRMFTTYA